MNGVSTRIAIKLGRCCVPRMARIAEEKREAEQLAKYKNKPSVGFGSQIRNYFLHPDQRVKDSRNGFQVGNFHSVMAGELQGFLEVLLEAPHDRAKFLE